MEALGNKIVNELIQKYPADVSELLNIHDIQFPMIPKIVGRFTRLKPEFGADLFGLYEKKWGKDNDFENFPGGKLTPSKFLSAVQLAGTVSGAAKSFTKKKDSAADAAAQALEIKKQKEEEEEEEANKIFGMKRPVFFGAAAFTTIIIIVVIIIIRKKMKG